MLKKFNLVIVLILIAGCLVSCNEVSETASNSPLVWKPEEYYTSFRQSESSIGRYIETPEGCYFSPLNKYIYFSEYGNTKYVKLCAKPDCDHNSTDCNAYIGYAIIGYYDGKIYYVSRTDLNCMEMDGSGHRKVKILYDGNDANSGYFHNGYYYYIITKGGSFGFPGNTDNNLYRVKVDDDSKPEIIAANDVISSVNMFTVVGDNIYLYDFISGHDYNLYEFSMKTKEWTLLTEKWMPFGACYFDEDHGYGYKNNLGFYEYDLRERKLDFAKPIEFEDSGICDAHYYPDDIYLIYFYGENPTYENQILYIYDRAYNLLETVESDTVAFSKNGGGFVTDIGNYIIYSTSYLNKPDYYIDKSEIGTGNLIFHRIEDQY
jgi:hypothetical protein